MLFNPLNLKPEDLIVEENTNINTEEDASIKSDLQQPRKYQVVTYNDDYTPQSFVVSVLVQLFMLSKEQAELIMQEAESKGQAVVMKSTKDIAETKAKQANDAAQAHEHPLHFEVFPVEE